MLRVNDTVVEKKNGDFLQFASTVRIEKIIFALRRKGIRVKRHKVVDWRRGKVELRLSEAMALISEFNLPIETLYEWTTTVPVSAPPATQKPAGAPPNKPPATDVGQRARNGGTV